MEWMNPEKFEALVKGFVEADESECSIEHVKCSNVPLVQIEWLGKTKELSPSCDRTLKVKVTYISGLLISFKVRPYGRAIVDPYDRKLVLEYLNPLMSSLALSVGLPSKEFIVRNYDVVNDKTTFTWEIEWYSSPEVGSLLEISRFISDQKSTVKEICKQRSFELD